MSPRGQVQLLLVQRQAFRGSLPWQPARTRTTLSTGLLSHTARPAQSADPEDCLTYHLMPKMQRRSMMMLETTPSLCGHKTSHTAGFTFRHGWPIRTYPWGVVEPMLSAHSDLLTLTHVLFELTPEQLKVATEERFSRYRRQQTGSKITMASL